MRLIAAATIKFILPKKIQQMGEINANNGESEENIANWSHGSFWCFGAICQQG